MGDILFLGHRVPYPPDRGDKIRGFHILKYLSARKRVHLIAFADDPRDLAGKAPTEMTGHASVIWRAKSRLRASIEALLTRKPISLTAFDSSAVRGAVAALLAREAIDTIYVFSSQMAQYLPARPRQQVIMDFVDMDSAKFAAYASEGRGPMAWVMRREANLLFQYERAIAGRADASLFVSEAEAELFRERSGAERVQVVENGIDTEMFAPDAPFEQIDAIDALIVFTGQMDYRPNIEAVSWFAETIFPQIRVRFPQAQFAIVGRAPSEAVKALARQPGVIVTGEVTDVRGWLAAAAVVVAPLKLARGIQNKVLEAMAMARPVVASRAAAEGIDHADTLRVGETAGEITDAVIALLDDPAAAAHLGRAGRARVQARYSWNARLAPLDAILGIGVEAPPHRTAA
ncbi:TIGR03087 family PEP-CTERM/XrtA system glycosyltransferase [Sphingomonas glacialis]|uniref:TIGR03087 family PEP-CTERM/XrtA system glycosyltransferase n=1 Tax=Sphingomonas glacialis TaxID=658225 RepID=A0A502FI90_9SPHN|nr:TIGR03087 family PEP-CTERM/XrtA system glycosyltransferase [Sphingomonas glacialis]TPG49089.1 TIGR03087 family PEP-CTERM/XrtA system glycosyltransferase [Sphingomonas glacialis]